VAEAIRASEIPKPKSFVLGLPRVPAAADHKELVYIFEVKQAANLLEERN
jgi:hypothetical protein